MLLNQEDTDAQREVHEQVVVLLSEHCSGAGLHLDLTCGSGKTTQALVQSMEIQYVGFDADSRALASLRRRGVEAERVDLNDAGCAEARLRAISDGRRIVSMSIIGVLEHVPEPLSVLRMLRRISGAHQCPLAISVPNISHRDVGFKLALGRWDETSGGLLDDAHLQTFTPARLEGIARAAGWHQVARRDVIRYSSDQRFPCDHIALAEESVLRSFLLKLRESADPASATYQIVRLFLPGPELPRAFKSSRTEEERPFLSVVTRTQGRRPEELREMLLSLTGQTCNDFEVLIVGHKLNDRAKLQVDRIVSELPATMLRRIRMVTVDYGNRTAPLNVGFQNARGRYISILDDDDVVFGHWVEMYHAAAQRYPGRVLRARVARQAMGQVHTPDGHRAFRTLGGFELTYPAEFDLFRHFSWNQTPGMGMAFPASVFHDLNIRFDEQLTTTEDWDLFLRTVLICGCATIPDVTAIYRGWPHGETSDKLHEAPEWEDNRQRILAKLDSSPLLLPSGSAKRIRSLLEENDCLSREINQLRNGQKSHQKLPVEIARDQVRALYSSSSWALTAPLRALAWLRGTGARERAVLDKLDVNELQQLQLAIRASTSWRVSAPVRVIGRALKRGRGV